MGIVENSRCHKCGKVKNLSDLKDSDSGIGKICINLEDCKKRLKNQASKAK